MTRKRTLTTLLSLLGAVLSGAVRAVVSWLLERGADGS
jgi:hypothetical protein